MNDDLIKDVILSRDNLSDCLKNILIDYNTIKNQPEQIQIRVNSLLECHTQTINCINNAVSKTHQLKDFHYNEDLKQEYLETIENFLPVSLKVQDVLKMIVSKHNLANIPISPHTYTLCQRLVNTFSKTEKIKSLTVEFKNRNIPITGFNQKFKRMKDKELRLQLTIGIPLLLILLVIVFSGEYFLGKPFNGIQLISLKALLALSVSVVGSSLIEGTVKTKWTLEKGLTIRAVGWVAVFLLLYFLNPANPGDVH
jgi:hypothetical protein